MLALIGRKQPKRPVIFQDEVPAMTARTRSSSTNSLDTRLRTAESLCEQRGSRLTPIRRKVLEILLSHGRSLKAYELLDEIKLVQSNATPPTVYRALDFLVEQGLIHRLDAVNAWTAGHDAAGEPHDLLIVCTSCGRVAELSDPALNAQLTQKVSDAGFVLTNPETELRALCQSCNAGQDGHAHTHTHAHGH